MVGTTSTQMSARMPAHVFAVALIALTAAVATLLALGATAAAAGPIHLDPVDDSGVRSYWTPERMEAAQPLDTVSAALAGAQPPASSATAANTGAPSSVAPRRAYTRTEVPDPAAASVRMQGKVFLTVARGPEAGDYVCSGTAINSNNRSVVWTAGHCVYDAEGGYVTNFLFVPGYKNGTAPFGEWPAVKLASPDGWRASSNSSYDFSAAQVATNGSGAGLNDVVGGRGIAFNQARKQDYSSFGYPAQQPPLEFDGRREFRCNSTLGGADNPPGNGPDTMWIGCDMTGGSSGGGWIAGGTLLSVNSYSYCDPAGLICEKRLYGPYLGDVAKQLYQSIGGGAPATCGGKKVTILGSSGPDKLTGTKGNDVIKGLGGKDKIFGKGGKDTICGNGGADKLNGGGGKDSCNGGGGRDTARGCEQRKRVP